MQSTVIVVGGDGERNSMGEDSGEPDEDTAASGPPPEGEEEATVKERGAREDGTTAWGLPEGEEKQMGVDRRSPLRSSKVCVAAEGIEDSQTGGKPPRARKPRSVSGRQRRRNGVSIRDKGNAMKTMATILMNTMKEAEGRTVTMYEVAQRIQSYFMDGRNTAFRRIYDIVNVCEGAGLVERITSSPRRDKEVDPEYDDHAPTPGEVVNPHLQCIDSSNSRAKPGKRPKRARGSKHGSTQGYGSTWAGSDDATSRPSGGLRGAQSTRSSSRKQGSLLRWVRPFDDHQRDCSCNEESEAKGLMDVPGEVKDEIKEDAARSYVEKQTVSPRAAKVESLRKRMRDKVLAGADLAHKLRRMEQLVKRNRNEVFVHGKSSQRNAPSMVRLTREKEVFGTMASVMKTEEEAILKCSGLANQGIPVAKPSAWTVGNSNLDCQIPSATKATAETLPTSLVDAYWALHVFLDGTDGSDVLFGDWANPSVSPLTAVDVAVTSASAAAELGTQSQRLDRLQGDFCACQEDGSTNLQMAVGMDSQLQDAEWFLKSGDSKRNDVHNDRQNVCDSIHFISLMGEGSQEEHHKGAPSLSTPWHVPGHSKPVMETMPAGAPCPIDAWPDSMDNPKQCITEGEDALSADLTTMEQFLTCFEASESVPDNTLKANMDTMDGKCILGSADPGVPDRIVQYLSPYEWKTPFCASGTGLSIENPESCMLLHGPSDGVMIPHCSQESRSEAPGTDRNYQHENERGLAWRDCTGKKSEKNNVEDSEAYPGNSQATQSVSSQAPQPPQAPHNANSEVENVQEAAVPSILTYKCEDDAGSCHRKVLDMPFLLLTMSKSTNLEVAMDDQPSTALLLNLTGQYCLYDHFQVLDQLDHLDEEQQGLE